MKQLVKKNLKQIIVLAVLLFAFLISLLIYIFKTESYSRVFVFPSADTGSYIVERRNLSKESVQGELQLFIDELLLGSTVERTKMIFSSGTKVVSCFQRGNVLYLDLSEDLLVIDDSSYPIEKGIELLKLNIKRNFSDIDTIELFIGKKFVASLK